MNCRLPHHATCAAAMLALAASSLISPASAQRQLLLSRPAILNPAFNARFLRADLTAQLSTRTTISPPPGQQGDHLAFLTLVCTVKNGGLIDSGPFTFVVNRHFNNGETDQDFFTARLPAGGSLSVELSGGFANGGLGLSAADCTVDVANVVPELNESNNTARFPPVKSPAGA
jgi:hypothetical protein